MNGTILIYDNDSSELLSGVRYVTKENIKEKFQIATKVALLKGVDQSEFLVEYTDENGKEFVLDQYTGGILET